MRNALGYVAVTVFFLVGGAMALLYVRSGGRAPSPVWAGGEIRVGYSIEAPYAYRTPTGDVAGAGPEVAKVVLGQAGIGPIRWVLLDFQEAFGALADGRIDMIANGLFITPERARRMRFSRPYSRTRQGLLVRRGNPLDLHAYGDAARHPTAVVAVLDGSVEQQALSRLGLPFDRLFVVPNPADGLAAVRAGRADGLALSAPTVSSLAGEAAGEVEPASPFAQEPGAPEGESAFAFRQEDRVLAGRVDTALGEFLGTPRYREDMARLGFDAVAPPGGGR
ncbi:MAG: transporter substrate-binding domain-containing protein [Solidesulfovibrio sp.]|uniref:transporter substrate-binding domain-containing protein n=1 Tax=Solidesulfovibrio sp. TaxID=2910990 RepID=UPI002B1F43FA|nr:transporter substrate-binding domain-containing protein [Solidesulfovibrio sp.]MEA4857807.1 transporter substrate-binding domain-containing protein [Solidesulfovibrio sp.]